MHPCGLCNLSSRQGTLCIAIIFTIYFSIQLALLCTYPAQNHFFYVSKVQYALLVTDYTLLIIASILLYVGAKVRNMWLVIPWLVVAGSLTLLYGLIILTTILNVMGTLSTQVTFTIFIGSTFSFIFLAYAIWVVVEFFIYLIRLRSYQDLEKEHQKGQGETGDGESGDPETKEDSKNWLTGLGKKLKTKLLEE